MANANNEPKNDGLENLPEAARKETEDIIKEIEKEHNADSPQPQEEKPKEEKPKEEPKEKTQSEKKEDKPEDKATESQGKPKEGTKPSDEEQSRKKVKLMPVWAHKTAEDQWSHEKKELEAKLAEAARGSARDENKQGNDKKDQDTIDADLRKKTDAIAAKYGSDPDEEYEKALAYRSTYAPPQSQVAIPKEIEEGIKEVKEWKQSQEIVAEETLFNNDFDKRILPLIQAEYGKDVPESLVEEVKEKVKAKAYSDEYGKIPLSTIYKGEDEFRGLIPEKQRGAEKSRGGHQAQHEQDNKPEGPDLSGKTELSSSQLANLTGAQFDTYSDNRARAEKR